MRKHTSEATTVIALATQLHTIATGNTYYLNTKDGYIYTQDFVDSGYKFKVTENANAEYPRIRHRHLSYSHRHDGRRPRRMGGRA